MTDITIVLENKKAHALQEHYILKEYGVAITVIASPVIKQQRLSYDIFYQIRRTKI